MFLVVYPDRGLVSSGLNLNLYNILFYLSWIVCVLLNCFYSLEPFSEPRKIGAIVFIFTDALIVELIMMKMRKCIDGMCLNQRYFSAIGGNKRRNLFTANECRHITRCIQFGIVFEEALLLGLPVSGEAVQSIATLCWCMLLCVFMPLKLLHNLNRDPPLLYIHPEQTRELTSFYKTTQVFAPRAATIDPPKKVKRNNEENVTPGCSIFFKKPQFRRSAERVIFVNSYAGSSRPASSGLENYDGECKLDMVDLEIMSKRVTSLNVQELDKIEKTTAETFDKVYLAKALASSEAEFDSIYILK